jgi:dihydroflavonol-4-reductase
VKAIVTGATGFLGGLLVRELVADGVPTRILTRADSDVRWLEGLPVERVVGDLRDRESVHTALEGCDTLFHVAAFYSTREEDGPLMYQVNVMGTKNVLEAASDLRYNRVVHTSTIGTVGRPSDGSLPDEDVEFNLWDTCSHYVRSKYLAELLALNMAQEGLPVVVVNPTSPIGPGDVKPSSSGKRVLAALSGELPPYPPGGLNLVAAKDVARGHILAAQRGRIGQRYILGNASGNLTLEQFLRLVAEAGGVKAARVPKGSRLHAVRQVLSRPGSAKGHLPAALTCDCRRAVEELGLPQTPLRTALADAIAWFREHRYAGEGQ